MDQYHKMKQRVKWTKVFRPIVMNIFVARIHSSRMRTACDSSRPQGGDLPQCMLGYTPSAPPPGVDLETPWGVGLETPRVWVWRPPCYKACWDTTCNACRNTTPSCKACWDTTTPAARHAGIPPAMHAGIPSPHPPPCEQNDRQVQKYYLAPNFVCGR